MTSSVICFSGRIGSGKTSVSRAVANALGAAWTGFGDFVRASAAAAGLDTTSRDVLQELGAKLIHKHGIGWLCEQVIARANWDDEGPLVIDGVRHANVLDEIVRQVAGHPTVLVHLAFGGTRENASTLDAEARQRAEQHSTERDVLDVLPSRADLVVSTDAPLESVINTVLKFLQQRGS